MLQSRNHQYATHRQCFFPIGHVRHISRAWVLMFVLCVYDRQQAANENIIVLLLFSFLSIFHSAFGGCLSLSSRYADAQFLHYVSLSLSIFLSISVFTLLCMHILFHMCMFMYLLYDWRLRMQQLARLQQGTTTRIATKWNCSRQIAWFVVFFFTMLVNFWRAGHMLDIGRRFINYYYLLFLSHL